MPWRIAAVAVAAIAVSACMTTKTEIPLAANAVQIQVSGGGLASREQVTRDTLQHAAQLTVDRGYTHFRLAAADVSDQIVQVGTTPVQAQTFGSTYGHTFGNTYGGTWSGTTMVTGGQPIMARRTDAKAVVLMYHADDPEAENALDANAILASG